MLLPIHLYSFTSLTLLLYTAYAGTPPLYPFDKPVFGHARCDNSLPKAPKENTHIKTAAGEKLESLGGGSGGRRTRPDAPIVPANALEQGTLAVILPSNDPGTDGVLPTSIFQYWENPFQYQVYASEVTSGLVNSRDPSTMETINDLAYDVLRTCCQFGYSGTMFARFSETQGDYIEVYVSYWRARPSSSTPLAIEGPPGVPNWRETPRVARRPSPPPSRGSFRTSQGGMVKSPSREQLLQEFNSGIQSPSGSGDLYPLPEDSPSPLSQGMYPMEDPNAPEGTTPPGPEASILETNPEGAEDGAHSDVSRAATNAATATINQFNSLQAPELQLLVRQCRDAVVAMNDRGQNAENAQTINLDLRETWCQNCCQPLFNFANDHQGITGCCILSLVGISTTFTVLNFFLR